ncbi:MAG: Rpn family recombination-promoting nuclease/putative transposase [Planctomycetaceae bacterium]|jgi:hypothetical protein|nr:Rpn family recombination-promoting nuclease/putative transposase [Planctomycetaceae bacterium]
MKLLLPPLASVDLELKHPHDLLTRFFLLDIELFSSLLKSCGDTNIIQLIDLNSLECHSPVIIDDKLQEVIGDLLFSAKFKNGEYSRLFVFFEHQSTKISRFWIRTLRKLQEFYEQYDSDPANAIGKGGKYPYPLVFLLYHGKTPWEELMQLRDLLSLPFGLDGNVLWFPVFLIDLSRIDRDKLKNSHPALLALLDTLISYSKGELLENCERIFDYFTEIKTDRRTHGWINALTRYFLAVAKISKNVLTETISKIINKKGAEKMVMSTMEELLMEGKIEGKKEGKIEGIREGTIKGKMEGIREGTIKTKIDSVIKILRFRFKHISNATLKAIQMYKDAIALDSLIEQALSCETLAEFERDLAHL